MLTVQANNDREKAIYVEGLEEAQAILKDFFGVDLNGWNHLVLPSLWAGTNSK